MSWYESFSFSLTLWCNPCPSVIFMFVEPTSQYPTSVSFPSSQHKCTSLIRYYQDRESLISMTLTKFYFHTVSICFSLVCDKVECNLTWSISSNYESSMRMDTYDSIILFTLWLSSHFFFEHLLIHSRQDTSHNLIDVQYIYNMCNLNNN